MSQNAKTTGSEIVGLNRDMNAVQQTKRDDSSGIRLLVPIVDVDQAAKEARVVVPAAYATFSTAWNTVANTVITPLI